MTWIIARIIALGVPERLVKPLLALLAFIALAGLLWALLARHDHQVIATHDAKQEVQAVRVDRKADEQASIQRQADTTRINQEQTQLEKVQANAPTDLDRRLARARCLRAQQAARAINAKSPDCIRLSVSTGTAGTH
jgi:hypothetical protein